MGFIENNDKIKFAPAHSRIHTSIITIFKNCAEYRVRTTSTPAYPSRHIKLRDSVCSLLSTTTTRLSEPFASTAFAKRVFRCSAPATWNSLPRTHTDNDSLGTFKYRLKTFLLSLTFNWHWVSLTLYAASASEVTLYDLTALQVY